MDSSFWQKQDRSTPLFPDVAWSKPERRDLAGKLAIIGGNSQVFVAVAAARQTAFQIGAGEVKVIMPESLKKTLPSSFTNQLSDVIFSAAGPSGGFATAALADWLAAADWANVVLFVGDSGANSETASLMETFLDHDQTTSVVITRDAVDLIKHSAESILRREPTHLVVSFSQLQKLFRSVYYPKVLTFNQGVKQIAETLHKFTISYPATISLWHADHLFVAKNGKVITTEFTAPLRVWSGEVATKIAVWQIWQSDPLRATATSWLDS